MIFVQAVWEEIEYEFLLDEFNFSTVFTIQKDNAALGEVYQYKNNEKYIAYDSINNKELGEYSSVEKAKLCVEDYWEVEYV